MASRASVIFFQYFMSLWILLLKWSISYIIDDIATREVTVFFLHQVDLQMRTLIHDPYERMYFRMKSS